jgi:hypothetical protein
VDRADGDQVLDIERLWLCATEARQVFEAHHGGAQLMSRLGGRKLGRSATLLPSPLRANLKSVSRLRIFFTIASFSFATSSR